MNLQDFDYRLPEKLIAQKPLADRSSSRLMVLNRVKKTIKDDHFYNIIDHLSAKDALVVNNTRVMPARLYAKKETGAKMEIFLLRQEKNHVWEVLLRPAKKAPVGTRLLVDEDMTAEVIAVNDDGTRLLEFDYKGEFYDFLNRLGEVPLPPYIKEKLADSERYQTVYAKETGSVAAPTAGLHFTSEIMAAIQEKGIQIIEVVLHVGMGTFKPVQVENIEEHQMHREFYQITAKSAEAINKVKAAGGRIISVGTTSTRTLETVATEDGTVTAQSGWTDAFIYPGYRFKIIDGMITNFHLPKSTLLMLVSALAGYELTMKAYEQAVAKEYRFFSFGDAMLII